MSCCTGTSSLPHDLMRPVNVEDKRLLNCSAVDVNQLWPLKYKWAWEHYTNGCANNWLPSEVSMQRDIELWKSDQLSTAERLVIMRNLGFNSEILIDTLHSLDFPADTRDSPWYRCPAARPPAAADFAAHGLMLRSFSSSAVEFRADWHPWWISQSV